MPGATLASGRRSDGGRNRFSVYFFCIFFMSHRYRFTPEYLIRPPPRTHLRTVIIYLRLGSRIRRAGLFIVGFIFLFYTILRDFGVIFFVLIGFTESRCNRAVSGFGAASGTRFCKVDGIFGNERFLKVTEFRSRKLIVSTITRDVHFVGCV